MGDGTYAESNAEILKRLHALEQENERLRLLVDAVRATLVRYHIVTSYNVWYYYLGGRNLWKITEVFNPREHSEKYGNHRYPVHGYQIETICTPHESFLYPGGGGESLCNPCFLSLSDAEMFLRGLFNGNPDMCIIVDGEPNASIQDL